MITSPDWQPADYQFMQAALEQAELAFKLDDHPFGAVIVKNGQIIGRGKSQDSSTGTVVEHAEIIALINACQKEHCNDLSEATIYTTNEPCSMCASAIFQAKIPRVVIGLLRTDLPTFLRQRQIRISDLAKDSSYPIKIESGLMKTEILELFQRFFDKVGIKY